MRRARTSIPVEFAAGSLRGSGTIRNVASGGLFIGTRTIPDEGDAVAVSFEPPGGPRISLRGVVWWTTREARGRHRADGFGLRLVDENAAYERALGRLLPEGGPGSRRVRPGAE